MVRHKITVAVLLAFTVGAAACSSASAGHGRSSGPASAPTSAVPVITVTATATETASRPAGSDSSVAGSAPASEPLRCTGLPKDLVDCLSASLTDYWQTHLPDGAQTEQRVLLSLVPSATDPCVRAARTAEGPFTCTADGRLFFPPAFQKQLATWFDPSQLPYAYASVLSHEYGHFLQLQLDDPTVKRSDKTQAQSRAVEQQADCLSGVWVHDVAAERGYEAGEFDATAMELIRKVSTNAEIYGHGTPEDRFAALDRGLGTGRPSSCRLAGLT